MGKRKKTTNSNVSEHQTFRLFTNKISETTVIGKSDVFISQIIQGKKNLKTPKG